MKKKIFTCLLCGVVVLGLTGCVSSKNDVDEKDKNLEENYEKYGLVEKEIVNDIIAKYNAQIMDDGIWTPAYDDYMVVENNIYWFALTEDITFYIQPVNCTEDKTKDIVEFSAVRIEKAKYDENMIIKYAKSLIKANNNFTDEEVDTLIKEAQLLKDDKKMANNGKGISVGILETDDFYEYQVKRIYK